jgi:hypothetical protein
VQLLVAEAVVERHERHAGGCGREQPDREGEPVRAHVRQGRGARRHLGPGPRGGEQLGPGELVVAGLHGDLVAATRCDHVEQQEEVHAGLCVRLPPADSFVVKARSEGVTGLRGLHSLSPTTAAAWRP